MFLLKGLFVAGFPYISKAIFHTFSIPFQYQTKRLWYHHCTSFFKNFIYWTKYKKHLLNCHQRYRKINWINKQVKLGFPHFFHTLCTFLQNSIHFQGL